MAVSDSILTNIKSLLDIQEADTSFDDNLIITINGVMMILNQLGVGPDTVYVVVDETNTWSDFLPAGEDSLLALVKTYVALKVKLTFDPSGSSVVSSAIARSLEEFEGRLVVQAEQ